MDTTIVYVTTGNRRGVFDITSEADAFVSGRGDGLLSVFAEHATAGLALIEIGAGSDADLIESIDTLLPREDGRWRHRHGSPGHGADHVLPAFISPSLTIPVIAGRMTLGTWQSLVLVDPNSDNPERRIRLSWIEG
ncbi:MAG: YjbQ family protein [Gammaproteobacteria bacterium]|nr:YjbQ family protein [Gammaproteobacteria bacterium]